MTFVTHERRNLPHTTNLTDTKKVLAFTSKGIEYVDQTRRVWLTFPLQKLPEIKKLV